MDVISRNRKVSSAMEVTMVTAGEGVSGTGGLPVVTGDISSPKPPEGRKIDAPYVAPSVVINRKRSTLLRGTVDPLPLSQGKARKRRSTVTPLKKNETRGASSTAADDATTAVTHAIRGSVTQKNSLLWRLGNANVVARQKGGDLLVTQDRGSSYISAHRLKWMGVIVTPISSALLIVSVCIVLDSNHVGYVPGVQDASSERYFNMTKFVDVSPSETLAMQGRLIQVCVGLLAIVMTVSVIAVQLSAQKMSTELTRLVLQDAVLVTYIFLWTVVVGLHALVYWILASGSRSLWCVFACYALAGIATFLLFPFLAYLFTFLQPEKIVARIMNNAERVVRAVPKATETLPIHSPEIFALQDEAVGSVEDLAKLALTSMFNNDKNVCKHSIDALCYIAISYGDIKSGMVRNWFDVTHLHVRNPDFNSLSEEAVAESTTKRYWLEWVVLGQYYMLFCRAMEKDLGTTILGVLIDVRLIAECAFARDDFYTVHLVARFLNTFLMRAINRSNWKVASSVSNTYRRLGLYGLSESTIKRRGGGNSKNVTPSFSRVKGLTSCENIVCDFMRFLRYYLTVVAGKHKGAASVLCGILTHDAAEMCEAAFVLMLEGCHRELLRIFLTFDDQVAKCGDLIVTAVRRGQIKLATKYLVMGEDGFARDVATDMLIESSELIEGMRREIIAMNKQEFWEITDRGKNLNYFNPAMVAKLDDVTSMVEAERQRRQNAKIVESAKSRRIEDLHHSRRTLVKGGYSSFRVEK